MLIATTMSIEPTFWMIRDLMLRVWTLTDLIGSHKRASTWKRLTPIATSRTYTRWEIHSHQQAKSIRQIDLQSSSLLSRKVERATTRSGRIPWIPKKSVQPCSKLIYNRSKAMTRWNSSSALASSFRRLTKYSSFSSRMIWTLPIIITMSQTVFHWVPMTQMALKKAKIWTTIGTLASEETLQAWSYLTEEIHRDTWWMVHRCLIQMIKRLIPVQKCRLCLSPRMWSDDRYII